MIADTVRIVDAGDVQLACETFGDVSKPPLLLIMGLATQMLGWPDAFCGALAEAGHYVIRFDNRDIGLSTHLDDAPPVQVTELLRGDTSSAAYTLSDMARDTVGLLDALGIGSAHVVGASMGGAIAQTLAIEHPERLRSLTSIMSTTGSPTVGQPTPEAMTVLLAPRPIGREAVIDHVVANYRVIGSPGYELDEDGLRDRTARSYDRANRRRPAPDGGRGGLWRPDPAAPHLGRADSGPARDRGPAGDRQWRGRDRRGDSRQRAGHVRGHGPRPATRALADDHRTHRTPGRSRRARAPDHRAPPGGATPRMRLRYPRLTRSSWS